MKYLRHLAAVVLAVAVIVGLGMLWAHASGGGTGIGGRAGTAAGVGGDAGIGGGLRLAPSREARLRLEQIKSGAIRVRSGNGLQLANTSDLIRTCVIEGVLAAIVIAVSAARRRRRRARRGAALRPSPTL